MFIRALCVLIIAFIITPILQLRAQSSILPDTVVAQSGEGIFSLLRRFDRDPTQSLSDFISLNKDRLGADSSLVKGKIYLIPAAVAPEKPTIVAVSNPSVKTPTEAKNEAENVSPNSFTVPLFGPKYQDVHYRDKLLDGTVYYLVAGHSGPDPGAIGQYGPYQLSEDEYAYDVTIRLARRLMEHGATVYMIVQDQDDGIRDDPVLPMDYDEVHYPDRPIPYNQRSRLRERVEIVNRLYAKHKGAYQRMLAIHIDSRSKGENIDVFFYHHETSVNGAALASRIHETFSNNYRRHQPNRNYFGSVSTRNLYVVKYSYPPTVFIELGNIKNEKDQRRFVLPDNRQALANWITEGILLDRKKNTK
jgi:N-acetylmuramoyl-L-alanine amidase